MKQLKRMFKGDNYYCEYAGNYAGSKEKKEACKKVGSKVRVIKAKKEYLVFVCPIY